MNDGVMVDKSGDDDTREVRWSWRRDKSGRSRPKHGRKSKPMHLCYQANWSNDAKHSKTHLYFWVSQDAQYWLLPSYALS